MFGEDFILDDLVDRLEKKFRSWSDATEIEKDILKSFFNYEITPRVYWTQNVIKKVCEEYGISKTEFKELLERFIEFCLGLK